MLTNTAMLDILDLLLEDVCAAGNLSPFTTGHTCREEEGGTSVVMSVREVLFYSVISVTFSGWRGPLSP